MLGHCTWPDFAMLIDSMPAGKGGGGMQPEQMERSIGWKLLKRCCYSVVANCSKYDHPSDRLTRMLVCGLGSCCAISCHIHRHAKRTTKEPSAQHKVAASSDFQSTFNIPKGRSGTFVPRPPNIRIEVERIMFKAMDRMEFRCTLP